MKDLITYTPNTTDLITEVSEKFPERLYQDDDTGEYTYLVTKVPTYRSGEETLSLVRCSTLEEQEELESLTSLQVLGYAEKVDGEWQYVFDSAESQTLYESVRGPLTEEVEIDGEIITVTKPYMIGIFA